MTKTGVFFWIAIIFSCSIYANSTQVFRCETKFPQALQVPAVEQCNQKIIYIPPPIQKRYPDPYFQMHLANQVLKNNNMGASVIMLPNHEKKIVYRSAILAGSPLCLDELYTKRHIHTIINLLDSKIAHEPILDSLEESLFHNLGGGWYIHALNYAIKPDLAVNDKLFAIITDIIKQIVHSSGDVLIHCISGEHDTGVIFGILQKCYNKLPLDVIKADALCHMGPLDLPYYQEIYQKVAQIIDQYPCRLLQEKNQQQGD